MRRLQAPVPNRRRHSDYARRSRAGAGPAPGRPPARPDYSRWKEHIVLRSLTDAQVALDFGAGRQRLDDPCIIRMDLIFDPLLDVVGDVHALPFKSDALDFVFGGAVMEHLPRPTQAADEMYRVLKPGGYVYADWNFLAAHHGYPHHYFNATVHGSRRPSADSPRSNVASDRSTGRRLRCARSSGPLSAGLPSAYFQHLPRFSKRGDPVTGPRPIDALPAELMERVDDMPDAEVKQVRLYFSRPFRHRLQEGWEKAGWLGMLKCFGSSAKRLWHQTKVRLTVPSS